jgi:hypothetical protein
MLRDLDE